MSGRSKSLTTITAAPEKAHNIRPLWIESSFDDIVWIYRSSEGAKRNIDFKSVPKQHRLFCKLFLWSVETTSDPRAGTCLVASPRTFIRYFVEARMFLRACDEQGISRFMDIDPNTLASITSARLSRYAANNKPISKGSLIMIKSFYSRLYLLGPSRLGVLPDGLAFQPDFELPQDIKVRDAAETSLIPDSVAQRLLSASLEFLQRYGSAIIECTRADLEAMSQAREFKYGLRYGRSKYLLTVCNDKKLRSHLKLLQELLPLTGTFRSTDKLKRQKENLILDAISPWRLKRLRKHLLAACYCVFACFTGFRLSEIITMEDGDVFRRGNRVIIQTRIRKTTGRPNGALVARVGAPILIETFSIVERLASLCDRPDKRVWISDLQRYLTASDVGASIRSFTREAAKIYDWHLTPHQFRRYFAVFYIRRFKGSIDALSFHFRHISQRMIETYVRDRAGAKYILEAKKELAFEIGRDVVCGYGNYVAKDNFPLKRAVNEYRASNLPLARIEEEVSKLLLTGFTEVYGTEWGYCMVQKGESESAVCGAHDGIPDAAAVHPGNCGGCRYLVVGREQLNHWVHVRKLHEQVVASPLSVPTLKQASRTMIAKADAIIARFPPMQQVEVG